MLAYTSPCIFASALMTTKGKVAWTVLCPGLLACYARVVIPGFADCGRARQEAAETAQASLEAERARAGELATELAAARAALGSAQAAGEAERAAASQAAARVRGVPSRALMQPLNTFTYRTEKGPDVVCWQCSGSSESIVSTHAHAPQRCILMWRAH